MVEQHYAMRRAGRVHPLKSYRGHCLYRDTCRCGFTCEAYGRQLTENQMAGHIKTMQYLAEKERAHSSTG